MKPPIGVMPRNLWDKRRRRDVEEAISRRMDAEIKIPLSWIIEYNELTRKEDD